VREKKCTMCGEVKPEGCFYWQKRKNGSKYRRAICKSCYSLKSKKYRVDNLDKINEYNLKNRDNRLVESRKYYQAHKVENAESNRQRANDWYRNNPENREIVKQRSRDWQKNNRERSRLQHLDWQNRNRERYRKTQVAAEARRRAKKRGNGGEYTAEQFDHVCEYYGGMCLVCGRKIKLAADHVVPIAKGGHSYISNIQPLCKSCNSSKRDKHQDHRPAGWGNAFPRRLLTA